MASMVAIGFAALAVTLSATAGSIADSDFVLVFPDPTPIPAPDLIPDVFDNCSLVPNGPAQGNSQLDTDGDGIGNACDADLTGDNITGGTDFGIFVSFFGAGSGAALAADFTGDDIVGGTDFAEFVAMFGLPPGPGATAI